MPRKQLELEIAKVQEPDRNSHLGGRSFYFFDFDDNIAFLSTPSFLFHKITGEEIELTSREFTKHYENIGANGPYENFEIRLDEKTGTFRNFRDQHHNEVEKWVSQKKQRFVEDLAHALGFPDYHWQGPSWTCFYHAVFNQRPLALITARGHHPQTLKEGISILVQNGHLPKEPNYLSLFPVSHPETIAQLAGPGVQMSVPELKRRAIRACVNEALAVYGYSEHHRFGMSDDDPKNIQLIIEEMTTLKKDHPKMSFFVIETKGGHFVKREIFSDSTVDQCISETQQLALWRS